MNFIYQQYVPCVPPNAVSILICATNIAPQYTSPPTALGFWIALEQCTQENGALSFLPGSHLTAPIAKRFVRLPSGGTGFEELLDPNQIPTPVGEYVLEECNPGE